ncbi:hypothetical protein BCR34DRAFT_493310 [Clohesyomyces aquaticus]|uniref:DUF336-domain-containing protein n=1 Tax=Clohesyomyces aquaticus TaxID=1231657 RepID=A0A1Y1YVV9_9PLEO|nr:hypothetical protein BCR34DRAFT_493310 [Clohesyomyces aquaticus]
MGKSTILSLAPTPPPRNTAIAATATSPKPALSTTHTPTLTLTGARHALLACEAHAQTLGIPMNIAIVDSSLHLLAFSRMDGAKLTSISIAMDKAFTAAGHRLPTSTYLSAVWPGGVAYGINGSNGGRFCTIGGGVPILDDEGRVLGAIGCSTGTPAQDDEVARRGVEAVLELVGREKEREGNGRKRKRTRLEGGGEVEVEVGVRTPESVGSGDGRE